VEVEVEVQRDEDLKETVAKNEALESEVEEGDDELEVDAS